MCVALVLAGCNSDRPELYPVTGVVSFADGGKVTGGQVSFRPVNGDHLSSRSEIQPDGRFELSTYKLGDGAFRGRYQVIVLPRIVGDREGSASSIERPNSRYCNYETSGIEFEVTDQIEKNVFEIVVEREKAIQ